MKKNIVFLCSGGGGNLKFINQSINLGWLGNDAKLIVIADRECGAINFANEKNLINHVVDFNSKNPDEIISIVASFDPTIVITTIHRILTPEFVEYFDGKLINIHYSLLPAFSGTIGTKPVKDGLEYGVRLIGVTAHEVSEIVDGGKPLVQISLPIRPGDVVENLMDTIFKAGCFVLLTAINLNFSNKINKNNEGVVNINNRLALINPSIFYEDDMTKDDFWNLFK